MKIIDILTKKMKIMNDAFLEVITASDDDRRALFLTAARRLGTAVQNVEKDFWVCWTLDALFNGLVPADPRLLFKGGTSLSKAYGLISRFSEDIDVTVFRDDLGEPASVEELEALSGKKRQARLGAIKAACQAYIADALLEELRGVLDRALPNHVANGRARLTLDEADPDRQTLLLWYPSVTDDARGAGAYAAYIRPAIKVESGAKSALDPHHAAVITPYVADDLPRLDLRVREVTTVDAERTFWDKLVILHGLRRWFDRRGVLRGDGQRVSRHYYDVFRLADSEIGRRALENRALGVDCQRHARMFFGSPDLDLEHAVPGTLALVPTGAMTSTLRRDYEAMAGMIFGDVPAFDDILAAVVAVEALANG